jgi:hypothetical protein
MVIGGREDCFLIAAAATGSDRRLEFGLLTSSLLDPTNSGADGLRLMDADAGAGVGGGDLGCTTGTGTWT